MSAISVAAGCLVIVDGGIALGMLIDTLLIRRLRWLGKNPLKWAGK